MVLRALVFDDDAMILSLLSMIFEGRGYEVFTFPHPALCQVCRCGRGQACADIVISDVMMPCHTGLEFVENQIVKGCKARHIALMSGDWSEADLQKARELGCQVFHKPFQISEINQWLEACEQNLHSNRVLSSWFLQETYPQDSA